MKLKEYLILNTLQCGVIMRSLHCAAGEALVAPICILSEKTNILSLFKKFYKLHTKKNSFLTGLLYHVIKDATVTRTSNENIKGLAAIKIRQLMLYATPPINTFSLCSITVNSELAHLWIRLLVFTQSKRNRLKKKKKIVFYPVL